MLFKSSSVAVKRFAAAKLRLLAKDRADNRVLIGESDAVPFLVPLLRCTDPWTQEHAVTALLNLSLHEGNKKVIFNAGAVKSLIYVLKTGTETSKQNAACELLSLALVEENKSSIGASGAIPPLVSLLLNGSNRGKKDALTTLYKLCSVKQNKDRAVSAGVVKAVMWNWAVVVRGWNIGHVTVVGMKSWRVRSHQRPQSCECVYHFRFAFSVLPLMTFEIFCTRLRVSWNLRDCVHGRRSITLLCYICIYLKLNHRRGLYLHSTRAIIMTSML
ncbi:hypothetical protein RYX36_007915 [Vicia faba]